MHGSAVSYINMIWFSLEHVSQTGKAISGACK